MISEQFESLAPPRPVVYRLARRVLCGFVATFVLSRILVLLIMTRRMPDLYLYAGETHVHHLNYGIFLLVGVGAWMLFRPPLGKARGLAAIAYGVGLGLTFDEFGMWLHLGGGYWQRASYDAVVTIGGVLGLLAFAPNLRRFGFRQWLVTAVIVALISVLITLNLPYLREIGQRLKMIESRAPQ